MIRIQKSYLCVQKNWSEFFSHFLTSIVFDLCVTRHLEMTQMVLFVQQNVMLEMMLVELIADSVRHINHLQITSALNCLKRAEKCLAALASLRSNVFDIAATFTPGSISASSVQSKAASSTAARTLSAVFWGSSSKPKNNILTLGFCE